MGTTFETCWLDREALSSGSSGIAYPFMPKTAVLNLNLCISFYVEVVRANTRKRSSQK